MTNDLTAPKTGLGDLLHSLAKGGLGSVPLAGSMCSEIFSALVSPPIEKKRQQWERLVTEAIVEMHRRAVDVDALVTDPTFFDTLVQAGRVAGAVSQGEKLTALKNAIINSGLPSAPDESERQIFVGLIGDFTVWHIRILGLFNEPMAWFAQNRPQLVEQWRQLSETNMSHLSALVNRAFPELASRPEFYLKVWKDLHVNGLVHEENLQHMVSEMQLYSPHTTVFGKRFLRFISLEPQQAGQVRD